MANPFTGKVNITEKDSLTVKNLTEIVKKLNDKAANSKDKGVQKKAKSLADKYQAQINKTALLYRSNKHKEAFKGYKLNQLSYKKILDLLGKNYTEVSENTVGGKLRAGLGAHPTENAIIAIGAGMATIGAISKLATSLTDAQKKAFGEAMKKFFKFLFGSPANAAITIGVGLVSAMVISKIVRNSSQKTAAIKEQIENEALDIDKHESDVEKASLETDQVTIAAEAYKDPQLLEHIKEMAANSTGAYTPDQMANAQAILSKVGSMHVQNENQSFGFSIQGAISNPKNTKLIDAFNAYNEAKKDPTTQLIEQFSEEKGKEAKAKEATAAFTDHPPVSDAKLDANLVTLKSLNAAGIKTAGYIAADGTIDRAKVLADLNNSVPPASQLKMATAKHKDFLDKAVAYLETKAASEIFNVQKTNAENADPNFKAYNAAQTTLDTPDIDISTLLPQAAELTAMGISPTDAAAIAPIVAGKILPTITPIINDPLKFETNYETTIITNLLSGGIPLASKSLIIANKDTFTVYTKLRDKAKQAIDKANAKTTVSRLGMGTKEQDLYDELLETLSGGDAAEKAAISGKYPDLKSLQTKFGANFASAEQMLTEQGLAK